MAEKGIDMLVPVALAPEGAWEKSLWTLYQQTGP